MPIMAVDTEVLRKCLDGSFTESVSLRVVGCREPQIDVDPTVHLHGEFGGKLSTTVGGDISEESMKLLNLIDACVCNICCGSGCLCCKVELYLCKPVCDNENCVEAV